METEKNDMPNIPFIAYEYTMARFERTIKRLIAVIVLLVIGLVVTNALWIYEWNQYDYSDVTVDSQDGGNANYIGASGIINNGEGRSQEAKTQE